MSRGRPVTPKGRENCAKLADHLMEVDPGQFHMSTYMHECGTPACIAGHAVHLFHPVVYRRVRDEHKWRSGNAALGDAVHTRAAIALGLTEDQAFRLFCGWDSKSSLAYITRGEAVRALRYIAKYGKLPPMVRSEASDGP